MGLRQPFAGVVGGGVAVSLTGVVVAERLLEVEVVEEEEVVVEV